MNTFDEAKSIRDLCEYYCFRCSVGLTDCKISAVECNKIRQDRDFESVTKAEEIVAEQTEPNVSDIPTTTEDCSMVTELVQGMKNLKAEVKGSERSVKGSDPLHDDCFDCDKFFTCDNKGEDYKTDCPWK